MHDLIIDNKNTTQKEKAMSLRKPLKPLFVRGKGFFEDVPELQQDSFLPQNLAQKDLWINNCNKHIEILKEALAKEEEKPNKSKDKINRIKEMIDAKKDMIDRIEVSKQSLAKSSEELDVLLIEAQRKKQLLAETGIRKK